MGSGPGHTAQATRPAQHKIFVTLGFGKQDRRRVPAVVFDRVGVASDGTRLAAAAGQSRTRIMRAIKPIGRLVPVSSARYRACTPGLSTWSSSTALKGDLVSRWVSRLDAFSGYPVRT